MKKYTILPIVLAVAGLVFTAGDASAQIERAKATPAEFPPSSFTGKQYVDSRGCVYVRAGVDGATRWVPRVARNRQVVCGFQPSVTPSQTRTAQAAAPAASNQPVQIQPRGAAAPAPAARAEAPAAPRTVVRPRTTKTPIRTVASKPAARPAAKPAAPQVVRRAAPAPQPQPRRVVVQRAPVDDFGRQGRVIEPALSKTPACRGASEVSQRYIKSGPGIRCGPQTGPIVTLKGGTQQKLNADGTVETIQNRDVAVYSGTSGATSVTGKTMIAPRNAYKQRSRAVQHVPEGYRPAWNDGRLNPQRAHQTLDGRRKMSLVWTNTVPRQLVDQYTGEVVTNYFPDLRYPYVSPRQQAAAEAKARNSRATTRQPQAIQPRGTVSSKSTPQKTRVKAASHRFVQVGTYRAAESQSVIRKLHNAGLPVSASEFTRNGEKYRIIVSGPYKRQDRLSASLKKVRSMGFSGATLRK